MATAFPLDAESGIARNLSRFTSTLFRNRYRTNVGDSNATGKTPLIIAGVPGQTADLLGVFDSSKNPIHSIDAAGGMVQGSGNCSQRVTQVTLSAAQITTLHSVPVTLVAAGGANTVLLPTLLTFQFKFGTVQFTGGGAVSLVYHGAGTNLLGASVAAATVTGNANAVVSVGPAAGPTTATTNTGLDFLAATADFAAGDSTAIVTVSYDLLTLG
jgi:hypothetical protein